MTGNGQRRAARLVCGDYFRTSSVSSMLVSLGWDTLQSQRQHHHQLTTLYKMINGVSKSTTATFYNQNGRGQKRATTISSKYPASYLPSSTNNIFFPRTLKLWNNLQQSLIDSKSHQIFKSIHNLGLNNNMLNKTTLSWPPCQAHQEGNYQVPCTK